VRQQIQSVFVKTARLLTFCFLVISILLLTFNVFSRYVFSYGVPWCEEAIRYSVIFASFFGLSLTIARNESMKIDVLLQLLKGKAQYAINIIGILVETFVLFALLWFSYVLVRETIVTGQITPSTDYPMYLPYVVVSIGVFFCLFQSLCSLMDAIKRK
jgi:TRAP-type C4-dicarboxylate transport system permease small subunit